MKSLLRILLLILTMTATVGETKASTVVNLVQEEMPVLGRFLNPDIAVQFPENSQSYNRYSYALKNPLRYTDPNGWFSTEYRDRYHNLLANTDDGRNDVFYVLNDRLNEFKKHLTLTGEGMQSSLGWNDYWRDEFEDITGIALSDEQHTILNMLNSDWSQKNAVAYWLKSTFANTIQFSISEALSQWTNPELVVSGLSAGVSGLSAVKGVETVAKVAKEGTSLWPAASGGRTVVNGIEYTTHALDRMQPIGTIMKGATSYSRGIPPSVVENAIKFGKVTPGNTAAEVVRTFENVRVITNPAGTRVISVFKIGN